MTHDEKIVEAVARAICVGNSDDCVFGTAGTHEPAVCHTRRWETYKSAARAAITAFQAEAWQPIENAPRDGTPFLGIGPLDAFPQPMRWDAYDQGDAEELGTPGYWAYCEDLIGDVTGAAEPTHWQPLPPAPKATPDRSGP